jgi:hypothetical protein
MEKHHLTLHRRSFLKEIHSFLLHHRYFLISNFASTDPKRRTLVFMLSVWAGMG